MSSHVYPTGIRGLLYPVVRHTLWSTLTDSALSGKVATLQLQQYALYSWELSYELIRDDVSPSELKMLVGLFNSVQGQYDTFLYTDTAYNTVVAEPMGVGDGVTTIFQTVAHFGNTGGASRADVIQEFNGTPAYFVNGTPASGYSLGPQGAITFAAAPASGVKITWSGSFYFRCRFSDDTLALSEFMTKWWSTEQPIKFGSVLVV